MNCWLLYYPQVRLSFFWHGTKELRSINRRLEKQGKSLPRAVCVCMWTGCIAQSIGRFAAQWPNTLTLSLSLPPFPTSLSEEQTQAHPPRNKDPPYKLWQIWWLSNFPIRSQPTRNNSCRSGSEMQVTLSPPYLWITLSNFLFLSTSQIGLLVLFVHGVVSSLRLSASSTSADALNSVFGGELNLSDTHWQKWHLRREVFQK